MSTLSATSSDNIQMDYMKLLITQLQNQNPLEPMDNQAMTAQLAQFAQLSQLESMNTNFADVLAASDREYANSLIGKNVTYLFEDPLTGYADKQNDPVNEVVHDVDGETILLVGRRIVNGEDVADSLVGQQVWFTTVSDYGVPETTTGIVEECFLREGEKRLIVGDDVLTLGDVVASLEGKPVSYQLYTEFGEIETKTGVVDESYIENGEVFLRVAYPLNLKDVNSVGESKH